MFKGSFVALVTPFDKNDNLDIPRLEKLINWHIANKTDGIVCTGTTGESSTLTTEEKITVYKTCVKLANNKIKIIAGIGCNNTKKSLEMLKKAKDIGVDGCLAIVPYYNKPTKKGIYLHFKTLSSGNLPIILYHHPGRTGIYLDIDTFKKLAKLENIVAIKESSSDLSFIKKLIDSVNIPILSGDDPLTIDIINLGGKGSISVFANILPKVHNEIIKLSISGNFIKAKDLYRKYESLITSLFLETNPQCVKYALFKMKKISDRIRCPLILPDKKNIYLIDENLKQFNLI